MLGRAATLVRKNTNPAIVVNLARESDNDVEPESPDAKLSPQAPNSHDVKHQARLASLLVGSTLKNHIHK
jgi:hypothetical protein